MKTVWRHRSTRSGFSIMEMMISMTVLSVITAAAITGSTALTGSMAVSESYSVGQLQVADYLTLDLRRATSYSFTTPNGTSKLSLPLTLTLPQYYGADGRTPASPQRTLVTDGSGGNRKAKKKFKIISARYYFHYGNLGGTVQVRYELDANGILKRKEGSLPDRVVGRGIKEITFTSPAVALTATADEKKLAIAANPMVNTQIEFSASTSRKGESRVTPPPLSSVTFMREYYYSE